MPPKKIKLAKERLNIKQKRQIKSRLLEISFKTDGYIYRKKEISIKNAVEMKAEVASYIDKCGNDVRCLQVIEKLTRLLTKIIEEKTQSSETVATETANSIHNINIHHERDDSTITNAKSSPTHYKRKTPHRIGSVNICDATTEMAINDRIPDIDDVSATDKYKNCTLTEDLITESITNNICNNKDNNFTTMLSSLPEDINNNFKIDQNDINLSKDGNHSMIILNSQLKNTSTIKRKETFQKTMSHASKGEIKIKDKTIKSNKVATNIKKKNSTKAENKKNKNDIKENIKNISKSTKTSKIVKEIPKRKPASNTNRKKKLKNNKPEQGTSDITTELAWIKDIKYIREINKDEFDPKLKDLAESFWDNCLLPSHFDENDFLIN